MHTPTRVLLVDDEHDFRELMTKRLGKRGVDVLAVPGGREALAALEAATFDVVILDVRMPGMDGIETLREMRRIGTEAQVIMLTGHASLEAAHQGMALGAFDYLLKPVGISELLFKIQDAMARKRHGANV
ncbi:DNA-binding response OmpR family regulator [Desulfobaculum xiamenense]|uniref:DNA-binding response OmpR family regulator n=1 Tax=Desulfobaculum xiamenense TaxID=995050 RepID=A0A846QIK7_9BACT|nr:response regulator [Desulfobaculum xiamenense]NJB68068.1 DNA-binding response OmpR family regulator [Desulfobaculum xiamenense]